MLMAFEHVQPPQKGTTFSAQQLNKAKKDETEIHRGESQMDLLDYAHGKSAPEPLGNQISFFSLVRKKDIVVCVFLYISVCGREHACIRNIYKGRA